MILFKVDIEIALSRGSLLQCLLHFLSLCHNEEVFPCFSPIKKFSLLPGNRFLQVNLHFHLEFQFCSWKKEGLAFQFSSQCH